MRNTCANSLVSAFKGYEENISIKQTTCVSSDGSVFLYSTQVMNMEKYNSTGKVELLRDSESGWVVDGDFQSPVIDDSTLYGYSIAISGNGNRLVISDPMLDVTKECSYGGVYIYDYIDGVWSKPAELRIGKSNLNGHFGSEIALSDDGDVLVVVSTSSMNGDDIVGIPSVYVYNLVDGVWCVNSRLTESRGKSLIRHFYTVSMTGDGKRIVVIQHDRHTRQITNKRVFFNLHGEWIVNNDIDYSTGFNDVIYFKESSIVSRSGNRLFDVITLGTDTVRLKVYKNDFDFHMYEATVDIVKLDDDKYQSSLICSENGDRVIISIFNTVNNTPVYFIVELVNNVWVKRKLIHGPLTDQEHLIKEMLGVNSQ